MAEGIKVMGQGMGQLRQDIMDRLVGLERVVVIPRDPMRGDRRYDTIGVYFCLFALFFIFLFFYYCKVWFRGCRLQRLV